jgi:hypothetical protein
MKLLTKTYLSAALFASVGLSASPTFASATPVDVANSICAGGDIATSLAVLTADDQAMALGEASRQLAAGKCSATQAAIDAALGALKSANPGNANLQVAYDKQKNSGQKVAGTGTKGLYVDEDEVLSETLVSTAAGEAVSKK